MGWHEVVRCERAPIASGRAYSRLIVESSAGLVVDVGLTDIKGRSFTGVADADVEQLAHRILGMRNKSHSPVS